MTRHGRPRRWAALAVRATRCEVESCVQAPGGADSRGTSHPHWLANLYEMIKKKPSQPKLNWACSQRAESISCPGTSGRRPWRRQTAPTGEAAQPLDRTASAREVRRIQSWALTLKRSQPKFGFCRSCFHTLPAAGAGQKKGYPESRVGRQQPRTRSS